MDMISNIKINVFLLLANIWLEINDRFNDIQIIQILN